VVVVAIQRGGEILRERLGQETIQEGDRILAIGTREAVDNLASLPGLTVGESGMEALSDLQGNLFVIRVREDSPLAGSTLGESRIGELIGLTVGGIVREGETRLAMSSDEVIRPGDELVVAGEPRQISNILKLGDIKIDPSAASGELESQDVAMVEVALAPRSSLIGRTLLDVSFRQRYGFRVLAVWREGDSIRSNLARLSLNFGDALLLQGPRENLKLLGADPDVVVLSRSVHPARRTSRAPFAVGSLALMIFLVVAGIQPIHVAAFTAASLALLSGALSMQEAYRAIEWRAIFLVAAILPVGIAMETTGAAPWLADTVVYYAESLGPYAVLAMLVVLSSLLSQGLDGAPTVVLLTPVVLQTAQGLGLSPYPMMMGVALAASAAFMTPFSHKANLLVMGAGGYRAMDYVKVGTPLTVVVLVLIVFLVPMVFPF
jgi:di/tricarboxylate transporter